MGFFHVSMFSLLSHLCLFLPYFSSFPLLLGFLKPKSGPSNEVIGIYCVYIYISISIYIHTYMQGLEMSFNKICFWNSFQNYAFTFQLGSSPGSIFISTSKISTSFGALLPPSEVRPCQATCSLDQPRRPKAQRKKHDIKKKILFGEIRFQNISTQNSGRNIFRNLFFDFKTRK